MAARKSTLHDAIEVFLHGYCAGRSLTHPYHWERVDNELWFMADAPRRNVRLYRKEEWVVHGADPQKVDKLARERTRGRYFVSVIRGMDEPDDDLRAEYKRLGYRLQSTEPFFVHRLLRVPTAKSPAKIVRVKSSKLAADFAKATRSKQLSPEQLTDDAAFRQYAALDGTKIVGWVRSVAAGESRWCSHMEVVAAHRRRGIGTALLAKMLRDDRSHGARQSVLSASHAGALLYPRVGYEQIGLLLMFAPKRK